MKTTRQFSLFFRRITFQAIDFFIGDIKPHEIALGLVVGITLACFPPFTLQWFGLVIALLLIRLNTFAAILGYFAVIPLVSQADRIFHKVGFFVLSLPGAHDFFAYLQNAYVIPYTQFNNTVVMGSFLLAGLWIPVFYLSVKTFFERYQERILNHIDNSGVWSRILRIRFLQSYFEYRNRL